jgi:hypothetical protein
MADARLVPGERLVERLMARGERRLRLGVSSAFFARFGLDNPWDFEPGSVPWGSWAGRDRRPRGVLGSFWDLLERRLLGHLMGGVLSRGGLGLALHHPWADWLPFLAQEGPGWLWRDRRLLALARIPGSGLVRRSPWGAYASPHFSFLLPELEELEPEQTSSARRFRRRPRRARRALPDPLLVQPRPRVPPLDEVAQPARLTRAAAPLPRLGAIEQRPEVPLAAARTPHPRLPGLAVSAPISGLARVLQRESAPVGAPALRRALEPASSPFAGSAVLPALRGPMAWAEARAQQAERAVASPARLAPVPSPAGAPPSARRTLLPVLFRSPSLAFLAPTPEPEHEAETPRPPVATARASRRRATAAPRPGLERVLPGAPASSPAPAPPHPPSQLRPPPVPPGRREASAPPVSHRPLREPEVAASAPPPASGPAPRARLAPTARLADRLRELEQVNPTAAPDGYRALRRPAAPTAVEQRPLLRAIARAPSAPDPRRAPVEASAEPQRSLDRLVARPHAAPGVAGRLQALSRAPAPAPAVGARAVQPSMGAPLLRGLSVPGLMGARSPMLAFLDQLDPPAVEPEAHAEPPRRGRPAHAAPPRERAVALEADTPQRPRLQAAARALLRAEPPRASDGSVLPRPVAGPGPRSLPPLSSSAFPGRRHLSRVQAEAWQDEPWLEAPTRRMRLPWLPVDRLVLPSDPELDDAVETFPSQRRLRAAPSGSRRAPAAGPPHIPAQPPPRAPSLRASARAAARLSELEPPAHRAPPAEAPPRPGTSRVQPTAARSAPAARSVARPSPAAPGQVPARSVPRAVAEGRRERAPRAGHDVVPSRASGTERALQRLLGGPLTIALVQALADPAAPVPSGLSRQLWQAVRAPSTIWLQWRDPSSGAGDAPPVARPARGPAAEAARWAPSTGRAAALMRSGVPRPEGASGSPWRAAPAPSFIEPSGVAEPPIAPRPTRGPALPSRRIASRLGAATRVQARARAVAGEEAEPPLSSAAPARGRLLQAPSASARPVASLPDTERPPRAQGARPARLEGIDKLLSGGAGARVLIPALARVDRPDEVLRIVLERSLGWRGRGPLPTPVRKLVEQVRSEAEGGEQAERTRRSPPAVPRREALRRRRPASARQQVSTPATKASATVHHVQASHRIRGLVKKLEDLIHLVDVEHRLAAARAQVRMAEDSPAARQPGSPDATPDANADQAGQDVDSLVQHIVELVNEEMSMFALRRPEDPRNRTPWF